MKLGWRNHNCTTYIWNRFTNVSPYERIGLDVQWTSVALLVTRSRRRSLWTMVGLFRVLLIRIVVIINSIVYMLIKVLHPLNCCVFHRLHWRDFDLIVSRALNSIHPVWNVFGETAAIRMNCSVFPVRIIHVLVFVNHRMEAIIHVTVIRKVVMCFLHKIGVGWCNDASMKHAITYRAMHEAVFVTQNMSLVDVTRVKLSFALFTILAMMNLKAQNHQ